MCMGTVIYIYRITDFDRVTGTTRHFFKLVLVLTEWNNYYMTSCTLLFIWRLIFLLIININNFLYMYNCV